jgi:hypothetical protein
VINLKLSAIHRAVVEHSVLKVCWANVNLLGEKQFVMQAPGASADLEFLVGTAVDRDALFQRLDCEM